MSNITARYYDRVYNYFCGAKIAAENVLNPSFSFDGNGYRKTAYLKKHNLNQIKFIGISNKIKQLFDKGKKLDILDNIIVHGSYGDYTANNYSDIDITLMFHTEVFYDKTLLLRARKFVLRDVIPMTLRIDPFQHHGPFILWPELLKNYDESILPIAVYEHAWASVETEYNFCVSQSRTNKEKAILTCDNLFSLGKMSIKTRDLYLIKRFLSNLMLLPAFFLMAKGNPCHKSSAYQRFEAEMGSYDSIAVASQIRANWPVLYYYKLLSRLISPLFKQHTLLSGIILGRFSRYFSHDFCMDHVREGYAGLNSICNAIKRNLKNG